MDKRVIEELRKLNIELCKVDAAIYFCQISYIRFLISKQQKDKDLKKLTNKREKINSQITNLQMN